MVLITAFLWNAMSPMTGHRHQTELNQKAHLKFIPMMLLPAKKQCLGMFMITELKSVAH